MAFEFEDKNALGMGIKLKDIFYYFPPQITLPEKMPTAEYLSECFECFAPDAYMLCENFKQHVSYIALCQLKVNRKDKDINELLEVSNKVPYYAYEEFSENHGLLIYFGLSVFFEYSYDYPFGTFGCLYDANGRIWFYKNPIGEEAADTDESWIPDAKEFFYKLTGDEYYQKVESRICIEATENSALNYWMMENCNYY